VTVREVAERLEVCRATVYRMIHEGRLQAVLFRRGLRG
jgi:excisionase family DNA binding protein